MFMSRRQARFIRQTLATGRRAANNRVIASLTTLPDRIFNLEPTTHCLLNQTPPPDELVLSIPEFSVRQQRPYSLPKYLGQIPTPQLGPSKTCWWSATRLH